MIAILTAAVLASAPQPPALPGELSVFCTGGGQLPPSPKVAAETFQDVVELSLQNGNWRVRGPTRLLPGGFGDGWYKLRNVKTDARLINGSVTINILSRATITLNRLSGRVSVSDSVGSFSGACDDTLKGLG